MEPSEFKKRNYLAAGCTTGIYVGIRADSCEVSYISPTLVVNLLAYSISEGFGKRQPNLNSCRPRIQQALSPLRYGVILVSS
jgi:hypothetical protein